MGDSVWVGLLNFHTLLMQLQTPDTWYKWFGLTYGVGQRWHQTNKSKIPAKMVEWGHQWNLIDLEENFKCGILYTAQFVD